MRARAAKESRASGTPAPQAAAESRRRSRSQENQLALNHPPSPAAFSSFGRALRLDQELDLAKPDVSRRPLMVGGESARFGVKESAWIVAEDA